MPTPSELVRTVAARAECVLAGPTTVALHVAVDSGYDVREDLSVQLDGNPLAVEEVATPGGRLHVVRCGAGRLVVGYRAEVTGEAPAAAVEAYDEHVWVRPSRYAESDRLAVLAEQELRGLSGQVLVDAVRALVSTRLAYVSGSSRPTDGAVDTLLGGAGVCRDFAHVVVALLRARDVPARLVSVYAPGLSPMDFHAVAEVLLDGAWQVVDATGLAPRSTLVRIATGRDAADTAWMSTTGEPVELLSMEVAASGDADLPRDAHVQQERLR